MGSGVTLPELTLRSIRGGFAGSFQYDPVLVDLMHEVGAEWDKAQGVWKLPNDASILARLAGAVKIDAPANVLDAVNAAIQRDEGLRDARMLPDVSLQYEYAARLYPYQRVAINYLALAGCGLLTDEMGLGKTVEMIATIREMELRSFLGEQPYYLIVCPNSVRHGWAREIETWYPEQVDIFHVGERGCPKLYDAPGFYIVNWEKTWRRPELAKLDWMVTVADESHRMKSRSTKQSKGVRAFKSRHPYALTGTPIRGEVTDLWAQLAYAEPARWPSFWKFFNRYAEFQDGFFGRTVTGVRNEEELRFRLETVMIGRKLDQVQIQLPDMVTKDVVVKLTGAQKKAYDEMRDQFVTFIQGCDDGALLAGSWLTQSLRLKQIAGSLGIFTDDTDESAKLDALMELLDQSGDDKWVIFSQFRTMVDEITKRLRKEGIGYCELTGGSKEAVLADGAVHTAKNRDDLIQWFQKSDKVRCFVATTQTGGEGITLTAANRLAMVDLMWTPGDNEQAVKRVHRIGQNQTTFIYRILAADTIDYAGILPKLKSKQAIIDAVTKPETP